jgi:hypothetical protein
MPDLTDYQSLAFVSLGQFAADAKELNIVKSLPPPVFASQRTTRPDPEPFIRAFTSLRDV